MAAIVTDGKFREPRHRRRDAEETLHIVEAAEVGFRLFEQVAQLAQDDARSRREAIRESSLRSRPCGLGLAGPDPRSRLGARSARLRSDLRASVGFRRRNGESTRPRCRTARCGRDPRRRRERDRKFRRACRIRRGLRSPAPARTRNRPATATGPRYRPTSPTRTRRVPCSRSRRLGTGCSRAEIVVTTTRGGSASAKRPSTRSRPP